MSGTGLTDELSKILENFDKRIHNFEQILSGSLMGRFVVTEGGNFPGGIVIDGVVLDLTVPPPVTGVTVTPGTHFENIYADVEWVEAILPAGAPGDAISFDIDLALKTPGPIYSLLNTFNTSGTNIRINNLLPNTDYAVRVMPSTRTGIRGATVAWVDFTTGADSTIPPTVTSVVVARGATTVVVKFDPLTEAQAADVAWGHGEYEVEIDTNVSFATGNKRSWIGTASITAFNDVITENTWYARVRAIDSSGNVSVWSAVAGPAVAGGVNDSMIIADLSAAKIQFGTMHGDRIAVNTLQAGRLTTSSLTAADITLSGGSFRSGNPPTTGVLINSQGIRLYQGGSTTVIFDAVTGNATFSGSVNASDINGGTIDGALITGGVLRTSSGLPRIELTSVTDEILFYSGHGSEVEPGKIFTNMTGSGGLGILAIHAPRNSASLATNAGRIVLEQTKQHFYCDDFAFRDNDTAQMFFSASTTFPNSFGGSGGLRLQLPGDPGAMQIIPFDGTRVGTPYGFYADAAGFTYGGGYSMHFSRAAFRAASPATGFPAVSAYTGGGSAGMLYYDSDGWWSLNYDGSGGVDMFASAFPIISSERFKKDIKKLPMKNDIDKVQTRAFKRDETKNIAAMAELHHGDVPVSEITDVERWGFVAEEIVSIFPEMVRRDAEGAPVAIDYMMFIPMLVDHVKDLRRRITSLEKKP